MKAFSLSVSQFAVGGTGDGQFSLALHNHNNLGQLQSGSKNKRTTPNTTVTKPSTRKTLLGYNQC